MAEQRGKRQLNRGNFRNPYSRGNGSAWARSSQGTRANAARLRPGRGMTESKAHALTKGDELDRKLGFSLLPEVLEQEDERRREHAIGACMDVNDRSKLGWLLNLRACTLRDPVEGKNEVSGLELYFLEQDGKAFKTRIIYQPYLYVRPEANRSQEVIAYCLRRFEGLVAKAERMFREDLDMVDHLNGKKALYVKLSFATVADLMAVKRELAPLVARNQERLHVRQAYEITQGQTGAQGTEDDLICGADGDATKGAMTDESESSLLELREFDVPYPMRVAIDLDIRVGAWYLVNYDSAAPYSPSDVKRQKEMVDKAEPVVCAFDIECTKAPLKFPDAQVDQIYMISYMIDKQGYLIVNREFVSEDIQDFEYTPKAAYPGPFIVFNEENEEKLLKRFFEHMVEEQPHIFVTYNGDFFDWPFIEARAHVYGINMAREIGVSLDERSGEYRGRCSVHMDAFCWVKRDSYLPQGSQGLKAVTRHKLGYDPVEVDAEDMVALARDEPLKMASYSVSDAVATFYLYDKYVHLFVFSLCTIIPLGSEDVLRKGSGTLCEALLMVEAFKGNIICPNKQSSAREEKFYKGHLVESETYVGGHVECLESGVFRADFSYDFQLVPNAFQQLIDNIDRDLQFSLEFEMNVPLDRVINYEEVKKDIVARLVALRERPNRKEQPLIYHLDVAAMYPNIILTNRLQPCAIVNEADCAACTYNTECGRAAIKEKDASCQREMNWVWRGDFYPATRPEYYSIKTQIEYENFSFEKKGDDANGNIAKRTDDAGSTMPFAQLPTDKQEQLLKQRFKSYCSSVYKKIKVTEEQQRSATVCMRENPFYVNTVRAFRDRRYDYKGLTKVWKKKVSDAADAKDLLAKIDAENKCLVYDSLQLAHKCILNSFYGYVMRKGARWHSMEMAGIVTHTGSSIITGARELVEQIGRPLELDTDGIWAILPKSFPENFSFKLKDGGFRSISYPCVMLNADVHAKFTNPQYHVLDPATGKYNLHKECSIMFEVDGPYKAMVLPASTEEGKLLKKRYAVFNFDNSLAELKGFELKRRGELQLIKAFQSQVFECFLDGSSLEECYASVAKCANRWLNVIDTRGKSMNDEELMALITEKKSMSGKLVEYEGQKSTSITTARRLGEFLGEEMIKDKGLTCKMIIAARPYGEKVTERAIPTAIFATEDAVKKHFLKKWSKDPHLEDFDIRSLLDWDYYRTRFASTVLKIISLPAAFQNVRNPVPRIELPDWMRKQVREKNAKHQQGNMKHFFKATTEGTDNKDYVAQLIDMEDLMKGKQLMRSRKSLPRKRGKKASDFGNSSTRPVEEIDDCDAEDMPTRAVKLGEVPFTNWLKKRKKKWKTLLGKRRREREERLRNLSGAGGFGMANRAHGSTKRFQSGSTSALEARGNGVGMENFVFHAESALQREFWQIVEIQQEQGGIFTCWILTAHSRMLQRITLKMPRVFYITCEEADHEHLLSLLPGSRRVSRIVPHYSSKPQPVLEVMLSERQYQKYHKEISQILGDPHVHGVYELQVSGLTRAVCALGCVAKVVNPHISITNREYELGDLQFQSTAQAPYLLNLRRSLATNGVASLSSSSLMRRVLLYFSQQKKLAILGLVVLKESDDDASAESLGSAVNEGDANVWYVDPYSHVKSRGSDLDYFFEQLRLESQEQDGIAPIQRCSFKTHVVKTVQEAFTGVNATLARLASNKQLAPKPTIVVAQTCIPSSKRLREKMQGLYSFPVAMLPWNEEDALFPALTWRKLLGEKMLTRCFEMIQYYSDVLDCARYAHLPVGNFTGDHSLAILDTLYSRILTKHKHLWWHSPSSLPDLGGKEQEQQFQQHFSQSLLGSAQQSSLKQSDTVSQHRVDTSVVVCKKGSFVDVCVELELDGLAINAILVASQIHSIEGVGVAHQMEIDFDGNSDGESAKGAGPAFAVAEGDAEESCHEAFRLLRVMVMTLFKDFLISHNKFADHVLQQFYRWLCSPSSLSFDPALQAMVKRLMEKLFLQLLAELRRLGSQVVYADFSKIIVCTNKKSVRDAQTYLNFVLQTVLSNELFQVLHFTPKKYFSNLFFLDAENYGCILLKKVVPERDREDDQDGESDYNVDGSDEKPLEIVSHWNIANYLPRGVDEYFLILVGQFIRRRAEFQHRERRRLAKGDSKPGAAKDAEEEPLDEDEKQLSPLAKYSQRLVSSYFLEKMLRLVPEVLTYNMDRDSFPVFAGSHLVMESPALELVKFVTSVFLLEPSVVTQVGKMRRTLLKLLRMSEFADETQFRNPSLSFTVQDVICLSCNLCRSIDLCRDPQLFKGSAPRSDEDIESEEHGKDVEASSAWHCPRCFALYDKTSFEMRLVEMVQAQSVAYQLQDLYCRKCHLPAEHKMREYCPCSGTYALIPGVHESLMETLRLLLRIAQQHNFVWLLETVQRLKRDAA